MDDKALEKLIEEREDRKKEQAVEAMRRIQNEVRQLVAKGILTKDEILDVVKHS